MNRTATFGALICIPFLHLLVRPNAISLSSKKNPSRLQVRSSWTWWALQRTTPMVAGYKGRH